MSLFKNIVVNDIKHSLAPQCNLQTMILQVIDSMD